MNDYLIKIPEGSYNYYEEVLNNIKGFLESFSEEDYINIKQLMKFIEEVEKTL